MSDSPAKSSSFASDGAATETLGQELPMSKSSIILNPSKELPSCSTPGIDTKEDVGFYVGQVVEVTSRTVEGRGWDDGGIGRITRIFTQGEIPTGYF